MWNSGVRSARIASSRLVPTSSSAASMTPRASIIATNWSTIPGSYHALARRRSSPSARSARSAMRYGRSASIA